MSLLKDLKDWFENQDKELITSVALFVLIERPDIKKYPRPDLSRVLSKLYAYLNRSRTKPQTLGLLLFLRATISFILKNYADVDKFLDSLIIMKELEKQALEDNVDDYYMRKMIEKNSEQFESRKALKINWDSFCEQSFTDAHIDRFLSGIS